MCNTDAFISKFYHRVSNVCDGVLCWVNQPTHHMSLSLWTRGVELNPNEKNKKKGKKSAVHLILTLSIYNA